MKKKLVIPLILSLFWISCKTTNPVTNITTKSDHNYQAALKGSWRISNVSYPGSEFIKVNSFQIADSKCFIGSIWNFIPNNNKGTLSLNQSDCSSFQSAIVWSINKEGKFILKIVAPEEKSKNSRQGFILSIANQSDVSFQLIDVINVSGQDKKIIYQFEKI